MANFEVLIRGAIEAKNASTPEQRQVVYQSSRNALKRLIESNRNMTVEAALHEQRSLEEAIGRIEIEFSQPPQINEPVAEDPLAELKDILLDDADPATRSRLQPELVQPDPAPEAQSPHPETQIYQQPPKQYGEPIPQPAQQPVSNEPIIDPVAPPVAAAGPGDAPAPAPASEDFADSHSNMPLEFARRRRMQRIVVWVLSIIAVVVLLGWLAFYLYTQISSGSLLGLNQQPPSSDPAVSGSSSGPESYITILDATDVTSLISAGRGEAQIVTELGQEMVRITSVRDGADRSQPARPILLRFQPGVLEQISGKNVTFELMAKSGSAKPAQFSIRCQFGALGDCGRKRFRVGLQPEAYIFAFDFSEISNSDQRVYIAINTDTTEAAVTTGRGDALDVVYARLKPN